MKAILFEQIDANPTLEEVADPVVEAGDVVVDVVVAPVLSYATEVFSGKRPMLFELPFVPGTGAIGRVSALGLGATEMQVGSWVYCDPTLRGRDAQGLPAISLQGLTASGLSALSLQRQYRNGSWAEKLRLPLENVVPIGDIDERSASRWLTFGSMLVPYGGLLSIGLQAGETVVINGATGNFGSAAVAVALAMGAARVVATGRNADSLKTLAERYGSRVRAALVVGDEEADKAVIQSAAGQPIDVVLDILPPAASIAQVLSAVKAVRPGGRVSLMGGVGMTEGSELSLPYPWLMRNKITIKGQWLYPREAIPRLIALAQNGILDLSRYDVVEFPLTEIQAALAHASSTVGPFTKTVLRIV